MEMAASALAILGLFAVALHFFSIAVVATRLARRRPANATIPTDTPVTLIRPFCGLENGLEETLRSGFQLNHRPLQLLLCVSSSSDPAIPLVRRLIAEHPQVRAELLVGNSALTRNPKLNNMHKGWIAAAHDHVLMVDSNVLMPSDHIARMFAAWKGDTGLVCSPPAGDGPASTCAALECAFLNTYQARWQLFADSLGSGFAQGKAMLCRRSFIEARGGFATLDAEPAEDATFTKMVRGAGLRVRLVQAPFPQPLGARSFAEVWKRQVRWGRLRRDTFPLAFAPEVLAGALPPVLLLTIAALLVDWPILPLVAALAIAWYGAEVVLGRLAGWPHPGVLTLVARDLLLPAIWVASWTGNRFEWRGNLMTVAAAPKAPGVS